VVIVLDVSASQARNNRLALNIAAARAVLATLTPNDWVQLVVVRACRFSGTAWRSQRGWHAQFNDVAWVPVCVGVDRLLRASSNAQSVISAALTAQCVTAALWAAAGSHLADRTTASGGTNVRAALELAYTLLDQSYRMNATAQCTRLIVLLSDGATSSEFEYVVAVACCVETRT
jgi:hypothetical protein